MCLFSTEEDAYEKFKDKVESQRSDNHKSTDRANRFKQTFTEELKAELKNSEKRNKRIQSD